MTNAPRQTAGEKVFFDEDEITVTNARFIVSGQTYSMRNITSVRYERIPNDVTGPVLFFVLGGVALAFGIGLLFSAESRKAGYRIGGVACVFLLFGYLISRSR